MAGPFETWALLARSPLPWLTLTLAAYLAASRLYRRSGGHPLLLPVASATALVVAVLWATETPYPVYFEGARFIHFLIGPATVVLAVPLYGQLRSLDRIWLPVTVSLLAGSATAVLSAVAIAWALGASPETLLSLAPKSATMPIAMGVAEQTGGTPSLTAVAVGLTGIAGALLAPGILNLLHVDEPSIRGFALGLSAHAIGTARAMQVDEKAGAFSALAMGLNGIATPVLIAMLLALTQAL